MWHHNEDHIITLWAAGTLYEPRNLWPREKLSQSHFFFSKLWKREKCSIFSLLALHTLRVGWCQVTWPSRHAGDAVAAVYRQYNSTVQYSTVHRQTCWTPWAGPAPCRTDCHIHVMRTAREVAWSNDKITELLPIFQYFVLNVKIEIAISYQCICAPPDNVGCTCTQNSR